ncbi:unnamed protein product [Pylaiella littoralis]
MPGVAWATVWPLQRTSETRSKSCTGTWWAFSNHATRLSSGGKGGLKTSRTQDVQNVRELRYCRPGNPSIYDTYRRCVIYFLTHEELGVQRPYILAARSRTL